MTTKEEFLKEIEQTGQLPPQIDIVEDGQNVMRPDIMQFLMTASIASQAVKIRRYFDDREAKGWTQSFAVVATPVAINIVPTTPSQTIYIINDGPANPIFVEINKRFAGIIQLNPTEDMFIDFETHKMREFWVYTAVGVAAARALVRG